MQGAPPIGDKAAAIEIYDRNRFFIVTGWRLDGPHEPQDRQAQLDALLAERQERQPTPQPSKSFPSRPPVTAAVVERAARYVERMPAAVSGQFGHDTTFKVACALVIRFGLNQQQAWPIISAWNERCSPPWNERDLRRKLAEADKQPGPRGQMVTPRGRLYYA